MNVDYKEVDLLKRFVSSQAKIIDPRHTGICAKHQRKLAQAIKRARYMGLLAYVRK
jgi:small subunit ribosomal protein S18